MLKTMRENMPLVMWTLVIAFLATIVFSWGMGGFDTQGGLDGVVGKIGTYDVMYDKYDRMVQDRLAQMRQDDPNLEITDAKVGQARSEVWNDLVRTQLMTQYRDRFGIVTSDEEVAYAVRNNPPSYLRENERFQTNGRFDPALYDEFLRDPNSASVLIAIENDYRNSLANQKVIDHIISPVYVAPNEVQDDYVARNARFKAVVISFPSNNYPVDSSSVSDSEIKAYFESHAEDYKSPETRLLAYVTVPIEMSKEDTVRITDLARDILKWTREGQSFEELAAEYSEDDGTSVNGGDLGWFTRGRMVAEFDEAAFSTDPGQITGPVFTRFGAHIIKVEEAVKGGEQDSVKARHILLKWTVGADTEARASQKARDFVEAAKTDGFAPTAAKFQLEISRTAEFPYNKNGTITGVGKQLAIMEFAFQSKLNAISTVYRLSTRGKDSYSVYQLEQVKPEGSSVLANVESTIRGKLLQESRLQLAKAAAEQFRSRSSSPDDLIGFALSEGLKVDTSGSHARREFIRPIGQDEVSAMILLETPVGSLAQTLSNDRGAYLAKVIEKTEADMNAFASQKEQIETNLLRTKQNRVYADWLAIAEKEIGLVDNRYLYYPEF